MSKESIITINLVHGGYVLITPTMTGESTTTVFTSYGKLMKAVRTAVSDFSLIAKKSDEAED